MYFVQKISIRKFSQKGNHPMTVKRTGEVQEQPRLQRRLHVSGQNVGIKTITLNRRQIKNGYISGVRNEFFFFLKILLK